MSAPYDDEPDWHADDDFAAARGIAVGFCGSVALWIVIGAMIWAAV